jgi:very-short-patch-repair endonuclease
LRPFPPCGPLWGKDRKGGRATPARLASLARSLRRNATNVERWLWQGLRRKEVGGFRFRRQVALAGFIADFASFDARLIIEVDGATHSTDEELARDAARTAALAAQGFALLRFTNDEVFHNLDGVLETIRLKLIELRPRIEASMA